MKKFLMAFTLLASPVCLFAEEISNIETSGSWIYLYNTQGKKYKTFSTSTVGTILGYSSKIFVSKNGSWIYIWDADGKKINTMSQSTVGDVIGVAGDTFTSRNGSWIYTWNKNGKKINTRSAH